MARCYKCGSEIFWAVSKNDKAMPMDSEPTADGRYVLEESGYGKNPQAVYMNPHLLPEEHHYHCHLDTCTASKDDATRGDRKGRVRRG